jgi:hypothetical protein
MLTVLNDDVLVEPFSLWHQMSVMNDVCFSSSSMEARADVAASVVADFLATELRTERSLTILGLRSFLVCFPLLFK